MFHSIFSSSNAVFITWCTFIFVGLFPLLIIFFFLQWSHRFITDTHKKINNSYFLSCLNMNKITDAQWPITNRLWRKWHDWLLIMIHILFTEWFVECRAGSDACIYFIQLLKVNAPWYLESELCCWRLVLHWTIAT